MLNTGGLQCQHDMRQERHRLHRGPNNDIDDKAISHSFSSEVVLSDPMPPPPRPAVVPDDKHSFPRPRFRIKIQNPTPKVCPLCQEPRIHPTALTGGYVFGLRCLLTYIRCLAPICPVTGKACPGNRHSPILQTTNDVNDQALTFCHPGNNCWVAF
jgi:hypothetical protein